VDPKHAQQAKRSEAMNEPQSNEPLAQLRELLASHAVIKQRFQRSHDSLVEYLTEATRWLEEAAQQVGVVADFDELAPIALPPDSRVDTEAMELGQDDALMLTREIEATIDRIRAAGGELASLMARMDDVPEDVARYLDRGNPDRVLTPEEQKKVDRENRAWRRRQSWIKGSPLIPLFALLILIVTALKLSTVLAPTTAAISAEERSTDAH
jgi:hypothetical protein